MQPFVSLLVYFKLDRFFLPSKFSVLSHEYFFLVIVSYFIIVRPLFYLVPFRCVDIVSSNLKSQFVLFAKLSRISGCVLFVGLLVVGGNKFI